MELVTVILTSTVVSGLISTFAAPYINWGIEKKKMRQERRKELLRSAREELNSDSFQIENFKSREIYSRIQPYLSENTKGSITGSDGVFIMVVDGTSDDMFRNLISEDLHKQEEDWGLI